MLLVLLLILLLFAIWGGIAINHLLFLLLIGVLILALVSYHPWGGGPRGPVV